MNGEIVLDASVAAKCFFPEAGSDLANALILSGSWIVAPDLLCAEIAHIAVRRVRREGVAQDVADHAVQAVDALVNELCPIAPLRQRAFELGVRHGLSAYDGVYLALAEARGARLATADLRLAQAARRAGLGDYLFVLGEDAP